MSDRLYETDVLTWSIQQADLLRRAARGERVNGLDWENLIEEIEDVGKSELRAVRSNLRQALVHLLRLAGWPANDAAGHWRSEVVGFLAEAAADFTASMRQRFDLGAIYEDALAQASSDRIDGRAPRSLPEACPFTLNDLLRQKPDIAALVERLTGPDG